jgi:hypothetical protein
MKQVMRVPQKQIKCLYEIQLMTGIHIRVSINRSEHLGCFSVVHCRTKCNVKSFLSSDWKELMDGPHLITLRVWFLSPGKPITSSVFMFREIVAFQSKET